MNRENTADRALYTATAHNRTVPDVEAAHRKGHSDHRRRALSARLIHVDTRPIAHSARSARG